MTILCGVDDSAEARQAAGAAAALAKLTGDELELVHAQDVFLLSPGVDVDGTVAIPLANQALLEAEKKRLEALLEPLRDGLAREFQVRVGLRFELGFPDGQLVRRARELEAALIVVGAVGRRSGSMWRLGSVPDRLSHSAPAPVLVVRDARAITRWALEERALRVLVALGTGAPTARAVETVAQLCRLGPCEIVEAHAYDPEREAARMGLSLVDERETRLAIERDLARRLPARLEETALGAPRFVAVPARGHVAEALAELVEKERPDLVVTGTRGRGALERRFLGSVSYGLLGLCTTNVLVAREREASRARPEPRRPRTPAAVRRVLVATDLSESGNRALDHGLALLAPGGQLTLLHVLVRPLSVGMVPIPSPWGSGAEERRMDRVLARAELERLVPDRTAAEAGVEVEVEVAESTDVPLGILQAAERHDADLVVIGRRGHGGALSALIGSSARAVAGRSPRPVLLVPEAPEGS